jgi:hypothetical protein
MQKYIYLLLWMGILIGCRKDLAPENPCGKSQEVKANFVIEELVGDRYFEGDTIADYGTVVRFRALQSADQYTWILGAETLHTQSFSRINFPFGWLDVKLVVKRKTNKQCFPNDDGIDTASRSFYVWPKDLRWPANPPIYPNYPIYGTYRGHTLSRPDVYFNIMIGDSFWKNGIGNPAYVGIISGMPYINSEWNKNTNNNASFRDLCENGGVSPKAFMMDNKGYGRFSDVGAPYAPAIKAFGWLDRINPRKITIEYSYSDSTSILRPLIYHETFVGEKIK